MWHKITNFLLGITRVLPYIENKGRVVRLLRSEAARPSRELCSVHLRQLMDSHEKRQFSELALFCLLSSEVYLAVL